MLKQEIILYVTWAEARKLYAGADSVHDLDHILRVSALAEHIARVEGADASVVLTAALLHDWGRATEQPEARDHAEIAAQQAYAYLTAKGVPASRVSEIVHAIAAHRFRTRPDPETLEAQVLFDADKLDAIGAVGIARAFAYSGGYGQRLWSPRPGVKPSFADLEGAAGSPSYAQPGHTAVDEFVVKLSQIKDRMYTAEGRRLAQGRHQMMVAFFDRLDAEIAGRL